MASNKRVFISDRMFNAELEKRGLKKAKDAMAFLYNVRQGQPLNPAFVLSLMAEGKLPKDTRGILLDIIESISMKLDDGKSLDYFNI